MTDPMDRGESFPAVEPEPSDADWYCGAVEPTNGRKSFLCTRPYGHEQREHQAEIDGEVVARWPGLYPTVGEP